MLNRVRDHISIVGKKTGARLRANSGFSLIEVLIALTIFSIIGVSIFLSYASITDVIARTRISTLTTSLLNKQIELIRNVPYDNVGIIGGFPPGVIPATTTVAYEGQTFLISAFVRNADDPFDGTTGGSPNDTAPADYKLVELQILCSSCFGGVPLIFTTWVGPQNLETSTKNGSLFISAFDANGQPVSGAGVLVTNTSTTPTITINDTTNNSGTLQLVDIPTSTNAYHITVTKSGYTTGKTYTPGDAANPNPINPHSTVASQQITAMSFAIDRVSTFNVRTEDQYCAAVQSVNMTQSGQKLIGASPNVLGYSQAFTTDSSGASVRSGLEWDTYSFTNTDTAYDLAGSTPIVPATINPNTTTALRFLMEPSASTSLLVTVVNASGTPVAGSAVAISTTGFNSGKPTGEKVHAETDWSGANYTAQDGQVDDNNPAGELHLISSGGVYPTSTNSFVESNTIDFGTSTTAFSGFSWTPTSQPSNTTLQFQIASASSASGPWSYVGPDGTGGTYFTTPGVTGTYHDGNRYLRYKVYLNTTDSSATPTLQDVSLNFSSGCIPSGQAFWQGIGTGTYNITATKIGYTTASSSITVGSGWQEVKLLLQ